MDYTIHLSDAADDEASRSLASFLAQEDELRGRIHLVQAPPEAGRLGAVIDSIQVAVGSGGAFTVLVASLVAWVRSRGSDVSIRLKSASGRVAEFGAKRIRTADAAELRKLIEEVSRQLDYPERAAE